MVGPLLWSDMQARSFWQRQGSQWTAAPSGLQLPVDCRQGSQWTAAPSAHDSCHTHAAQWAQMALSAAHGSPPCAPSRLCLTDSGVYLVGPRSKGRTSRAPWGCTVHHHETRRTLRKVLRSVQASAARAQCCAAARLSRWMPPPCTTPAAPHTPHVLTIKGQHPLLHRVLRVHTATWPSHPFAPLPAHLALHALLCGSLRGGRHIRDDRGGLLRPLVGLQRRPQLRSTWDAPCAVV